MVRQDKRTFIKSLSALLLGTLLPTAAKANASAYHHLVVLGDLHLPGNNLAIKEQVLQTTNTSNDLDIVVTVGDLMVGDYALIFLSTDSPGHLTEISPTQMEWFRKELEHTRQRLTIVFFHAPLDGTLDSYNSNVNSPNFVAQPAATIHNLLANNPQVFMWVSGHTHTAPSRESFASPIHRYDGRVMNIHCTDMQDRNVVWTNSLFLYPDRVVVKTYDHGKGAWMRKLEREIFVKPA